MAGKASFWLDAPKGSAPVVSGVPGKVVGAGENGTVRVEVGEPGNVVNVPSGGGVFKPGSDVRVQVDASGAPSGVLDAGPSVTVGGLVYAGAEGQRVREVADAAQVAHDQAERAMRELEEARGRTAQDMASLRSTLQGAQADVSNARLMFSTSEKDPKSYFRDIGTEPPLNAVYEQRGAGGAVEYRFRWDGRNWVEFNLGTSSVHVDQDMWTRMLHVAGNGTITGNLIAGGSVTADKIVASKELSAKVAKFEESVVSRLRAEKAVISGDLIAENLTGKTITGSVVRAVDDGGQVELSAPAGKQPNVSFRKEVYFGAENEVKLTPEGLQGRFLGSSNSDFKITWDQLLSAPYYRMVSGNTYIGVPKNGVLKVPLRADTSARGAQIKVVNNNSVLVPKAGRYRVSGWACVQSGTWDTVTQVALLRGDAQDANWGDLYGYAIAPVGSYSTPQFAGLIDIKTSERVSLGVKTNGTSYVRDYRFEVEFVCPL